MSASLIETERLTLRKLSVEDAPFILRLVNEPSFLQFIGDKGVRNLEDARQYILNGPVASYAQNGFGLFLVQLKANQAPLGMCGLLKRETLEDADGLVHYLCEKRWIEVTPVSPRCELGRSKTLTTNVPV